MNSSYAPTKRRLFTGILGTFALAALTVGVAAPARAAAAPADVYVALGDSMPSGPLIPSITGPVGCGRSSNNYPHELADRLDAGTLRDVTCSGASSKHLTEPQSTSVLDVPAETVPPQFDALSAATTLVTLTIGGNDTGLVGVAEDCVRLDPTARPCKDEFTSGGVDRVAERIQAFEPKLSAALGELARRAPNARVVLTGYGLYIKPRGCWPVQPVLPVDADYLQGNVNKLNTVIARQAAAHGGTYVDLVTPSAGHDTCQSPSRRWIEGYVPTTLAAPLHPNAAGEANYARIIAGVIGS
ncbi:SGNH/GDSL hydrolase family protein [Spirillospora sp. NPDC047279]|uniref:SGNH/GDSL hydrolase family protein n=1 Tax=Spirillospora sp. NPDC047279 TaxID=3155478 RepID=UPI0034076EC0